MASDRTAEVLVSLAGGFIGSLLTVISFRTLPSLGTPPEIYYSLAVIATLVMVLVSFRAFTLCFIYVLFMFFHGYFFVDPGFITLGMATSVALVGASILRGIYGNWVETRKKKKLQSQCYPDMR